MYLISFCRYVYKRYNRAVQYAFTFAVKKETPKRRVRVFPIFFFTKKHCYQTVPAIHGRFDKKKGSRLS